MPQPECICCGSQQWVRVTFLPKGIFRVRAMIEKCKNCGFGRTMPPPNTFFDHYEVAADFTEQMQQRSSDYRKFAQDLLADVPRKHGRLLDIGCGGGFLVEEAQKRGFDAHGIEANAASVKWCQQRGLNVSQADVNQFAQGDKFDVIVISAVLEHLENPAALLRSAENILAPGGVVVVSQASFDGLLPRVLPWMWYGWGPHEHFWHFTPQSFEKFATRNGFAVNIIRNSLHHAWYFKGKNIVRNPATALAKVGNALGRGDSFNAVLHVISPLAS